MEVTLTQQSRPSFVFGTAGRRVSKIILFWLAGQPGGAARWGGGAAMTTRDQTDTGQPIFQKDTNTTRALYYKHFSKSASVKDKGGKSFRAAQRGPSHVVAIWDEKIVFSRLQ